MLYEISKNFCCLIMAVGKKKDLLGRVVSVEYLLWYSEEAGGNVRKYELQTFQGLCIEVRQSGGGPSLVLSHKVGGVWVFRRFMLEGAHIVGLKVLSS